MDLYEYYSLPEKVFDGPSIVPNPQRAALMGWDAVERGSCAMHPRGGHGRQTRTPLPPAHIVSTRRAEAHSTPWNVDRVPCTCAADTVAAAGVVEGRRARRGVIPGVPWVAAERPFSRSDASTRFVLIPTWVKLSRSKLAQSTTFSAQPHSCPHPTGKAP